MDDGVTVTYTLQEGVTAFLQARRRKLAESSYVEYERVLVKMMADLGTELDVRELEPPAGADVIEGFLTGRWADKPFAFNRNLSVVRSLVGHMVQRGHLSADPCALIDRSKPERHARTTFDDETVRRIIDSADNPRDRVALKLLLVYGLRKGALTNLSMVCFDHVRQSLTFYTKGHKYHTVPLAGDQIWTEIREVGGHPADYLLHRKGNPQLPMSPHGTHLWWYERLADAGVVEPGTTSGERLHKCRHTAGQRVLDATGNLKAVQTLLGHASIATTGDVYTDWDSDALRATMAGLDS